VATKAADPAYISLEAELPWLSPSYLISLGNNIGNLIGTVKDATGATIEGVEVNFEVLYPEVGTFGASQRTISAISNAGGEAKVVYNSPPTIQDVGQASDLLTGGNKVLTVDGITNPGTVSGLFLYEIHRYDLALGIPDDEVDQYYTDYLDEEDITDGTTADEDWEADWRTIHELGKPVTYDPNELDDLAIGKKTIVTTTKPDAINPHTGQYDPTTLVPLYPNSIEDVGTEETPSLRLTYNQNLLPIEPGSRTKAYFLVGDARTNVRAWCLNKRTNQRVYSNTIGIRVIIPDTVNGTFFIEELNDSGLLTRTRQVDIDNADVTDANLALLEAADVFSREYQDEKQLLSTGPNVWETYTEWFRRTRRGDTMGLIEASETVSGFDPGLITLSNAPDQFPGELPLGFRLKSTGITVASMLDQITYLDPNDHLPSGYWDV